MKAKKWNKNEIKILINNYSNFSVSKLLILLPNRTIRAIKSKAIKLKLKKNIKEFGYNICLLCNNKFKKNGQIGKVGYLNKIIKIFIKK